jgi:hypothetical protein
MNKTVSTLVTQLAQKFDPLENSSVCVSAFIVIPTDARGPELRERPFHLKKKNKMNDDFVL